MVGKGEGKGPMMVGEHESRLSVSHASFNSVGQIATASYDDTVKIYTFNMSNWSPGHEISEKEMQPSDIIRHNNQTGRWVTMYVSSISPFPPFPPPLNTSQSPRPMATEPARPRTAFLHRKHEPLRRYLYRERGAAGAVGRRGYLGGAVRSAVSSQPGLGGGGDGKREIVLVDVGGRDIGFRVSGVYRRGCVYRFCVEKYRV